MSQVMMRLPQSGEQLVRWVQVLLKSSGEDSLDDMKGLVHQATVRADVVVALIQELKDRGHRAYKNLDMTYVRNKAHKTLPADGVPAEIMHLVKIDRSDDSLDRVQIQKAATPVPGRCSEAAAANIFKTVTPNAVVCEPRGFTRSAWSPRAAGRTSVALVDRGPCFCGDLAGRGPRYYSPLGSRAALLAAV